MRAFRLACLVWSLPMLLPASACAQGRATPEQVSLLEQMRRVLPPSPPWDEWQRSTGELPPRLDSLPVEPGLPDPLVRERPGSRAPIQGPEEWTPRRQELLLLFQQWVFGRVPPAPGNLRSRVLSERREEGATVREVELTFGPGHRARLRLELLIPPGKGPFPVFMTQHNHRGWALIALRRGYLGCVYAGADSQDDTDTFVAAYPGHDWSRLARRAWAAGRCIDYLETLPEADAKRVALTGHSRNGKLSLIASALDPRVAVVISSSSGAGGTMPARLFREPHFGEGIEQLTRAFPDWFHPRLRFFAGRENRLPIDMHELVALSAPRPCLLSIALNDGVESSWAMEQTYRSAQRVYRLLDAEPNLRILWRSGSHETWPAVIERYLDWCDLHFGRGRYEFPERMLHPWDWEAWRRESGESVRVESFPRRASGEVLEREEVRRHARWMLGEEPPAALNPGHGYGTEPEHVASLLGRGSPGEGVRKLQVVFGEYINGDVYLPAGLQDSGHKAPAVLWLHPASYSDGYVGWYSRDGGGRFFRDLARAGYVVFCFDQIGFGRRTEEVEGFYRRHPRWSLLGKMVRDSRAALDVLERLPFVDARRIYALGYGMGSLVGLHLGALDDRLAGFLSIAGPPPFRTDTSEKGTGGIARWSRQILWAPRLGFFVGQEPRVPYDLPDLLASLAPKPVLVLSPSLSWDAPVEDVTRGVEAARRAYASRGAAEALQYLTPEDIPHFGRSVQTAILDWLKARTGR